MRVMSKVELKSEVHQHCLQTRDQTRLGLKERETNEQGRQSASVETGQKSYGEIRGRESPWNGVREASERSVSSPALKHTR